MRERTLELIAWAHALAVERALLAALLAAVFMMGLGSAWDAQWHAVVGRDSFWIPPHTLIYSAVVLAGALTLLVVLRAGPEAWSTHPLAIVRTLSADGYGVAGTGAVTILGAAVFDEVWHRTIGDSTIWSPPHVLGVIGGVIIGLGTMIAVLQGQRRQILPPSWTRMALVMLLAGTLVAVYFGMMPAAVMAFHPQGAGFHFFTTSSPYFLAAVASLTAPAVVTGAQELLGRTGFEIAAAAGAVLWVVQQMFHLLATPFVAEQFGYVSRPAGFADLRFEVSVLGFVVLPGLLVNRVILRRPLTGGGLMGLLYIGEVAFGLGILGKAQPASGLGIAGVIVLGLTSAAFGLRGGRWIRRAASHEE